MDQQMLQILDHSVSAWARPDSARVRLRRDEKPGFSRQTWSELAAQGWLAVLAPESAGGLNLGVTEAAVIARRLGYALYSEPYSSTAVFALSCASSFAGTPAMTERLASFCSGQMLPSLAWQDARGSIALDSSPGTLRENGNRHSGNSDSGNGLSNGLSLSGNYHFVPTPSADGFIILAAAAAGPALLWVDREQRGLNIEAHALADGSECASLSFNDAPIRPEQLIASGDPVREAFALAFDRALLASSAELVGNMERCLEMTLTYLRERKQFGRAIGSFQALKHRAVDLWIQKELARVAVERAAHKADEPGISPQLRAALASGAKMRASQAALKMSTEAIQMHGAIGFTDDFDLGLYLKRALVLSAQFGNGAAHRRRFGELAPSE